MKVSFIIPARGGKDRNLIGALYGSHSLIGSTPVKNGQRRLAFVSGKLEPGNQNLFWTQIWSETVDRAQKEKLVDELGQIFESSGVVVVAHYEGMTVAEMQDLRAQMREAGGTVRVAKNKLAKIALEGKPCESIGEYLSGMTVLASSEDPVAAAKAVKKFTKDNEKLTILGGAMGDEILDVQAVTALAAMPSRDELIASIVATISSPASELAGAIGAPASNIAGILETLETRDAA